MNNIQNITPLSEISIFFICAVIAITAITTGITIASVQTPCKSGYQEITQYTGSYHYCEGGATSNLVKEGDKVIGIQCQCPDKSAK